MTGGGAICPMRASPVNAFEQHGKLRRGQADLARLRHRPDEPATGASCIFWPAIFEKGPTFAWASMA